MVDIITSLIAHCKADATLVALLPAATSIATEFDVVAATLPQVLVNETGRERIYGGPCIVQVRFWIRAASRSSAINIRNRIAALFDDGSWYLLASGANELRVVLSQYKPGEAIGREDMTAAFELQEHYEFNIVPDA